MLLYFVFTYLLNGYNSGIDNRVLDWVRETTRLRE